jgi:hypothetical protein
VVRNGAGFHAGHADGAEGIGGVVEVEAELDPVDPDRAERLQGNPCRVFSGVDFYPARGVARADELHDLVQVIAFEDRSHDFLVELAGAVKSH